MKLRQRALELDPEDAADTTNATATEPQPEDDGGEEQLAADVARAAFMAERVLSPKRNLRADDEVEVAIAGDSTNATAPEPEPVEPQPEPTVAVEPELLARALHSFVAEDAADLGFAEGEVRGPLRSHLN